jgi:hypothetical protein
MQPLGAQGPGLDATIVMQPLGAAGPGLDATIAMQPLGAAGPGLDATIAMQPLVAAGRRSRPADAADPGGRRESPQAPGPGLAATIVMQPLARRLDEFVEAHDLGEIYVGDVGFVLKRDPDTVRGPDLAFVRNERVAAVEAAETFSDVMPDLCAEILSPSDRWADVERELDQLGLTGR